MYFSAVTLAIVMVGERRGGYHSSGERRHEGGVRGEREGGRKRRRERSWSQREIVRQRDEMRGESKSI